jgi:hypothetical protein
LNHLCCPHYPPSVSEPFRCTVHVCFNVLPKANAHGGMSASPLPQTGKSDSAATALWRPSSSIVRDGRIPQKAPGTGSFRQRISSTYSTRQEPTTCKGYVQPNLESLSAKSSLANASPTSPLTTEFSTPLDKWAKQPRQVRAIASRLAGSARHRARAASSQTPPDSDSCPPAIASPKGS